MSLEQRRNQAIPGYEHPETLSTNRDRVYKTFTEGKKAKKNEKFGRTNVGSQYAKFSAEETEKPEECPVCNEPCAKTCPCGHSDKTCPQGHVWYTNRDGKTLVGNPHT